MQRCRRMIHCEVHDTVLSLCRAMNLTDAFARKEFGHRIPAEGHDYFRRNQIQSAGRAIADN